MKSYTKQCWLGQWVRGQETGNPNTECFSLALLYLRALKGVLSGQQAGSLWPGTLTFSTHPAQHRHTCFKRVQIEEIPAVGTPQYKLYTCVGGRAGLKVEMI